MKLMEISIGNEERVSRGIGGHLICFGIPLTIMTLAYAWLVIDHRTISLWGVNVHESGRYTLGQTILYFRHFLRELPVDIAYALFILSAFASVIGFDCLDLTERRRCMVLMRMGLGTALGLVTVATLIIVYQISWWETVLELLQFRTRDELFKYGSHWHFHWLSTLWFGVTALLSAPLLARLYGVKISQGPKERHAIWWVPWLYFGSLTVVWGLSSETFTDVRYVGHQLREILTHGPVTGLLAFGALFLAAGWVSNCRWETSRVECIGSETLVGGFQFWGVLAIPVYLVVVTASGDVMGAGQSKLGLAAMIGAHFFEHTLDYLLVVLLVVGSFGLVAERQMRKRNSG